MSTSVRSKRVGAGRVIFGVLSAVVFSAMAMVLAGCSGGETTGGGGGGDDYITSLAEDRWTYGGITSNTPDRAVYYQFNVVRGRTYWVSWDDEYSGPETGTLDIEIKVIYSDGTIIFAGDDWELTPPSFTADRSGTVQIMVTPVGSDDGTFGVMWTTTDPRGSVGGDRQLVLGANEAWVATIEEEEVELGFIFKSNGDLVEIIYYVESVYGEGWFGGVAGWWSTSGNTIALAIESGGEIITGTYRVSGNTLTITIHGEPEPITFTKRSNIIYEDIGHIMSSPDNGETQLNKILSQKQSSLFKKPSQLSFSK